ncbi:unnamed protein product [Paramecium sonneborni]|uniref:Uncharacterized protein n=1 Tax=Paramecium sonneborni TaxID=65129 RepID=A0A8S1RJ56_9CILI|nr:unnamed protein product [Paramecium sonneborni]
MIQNPISNGLLFDKLEYLKNIEWHSKISIGVVVRKVLAMHLQEIGDEEQLILFFEWSNKNSFTKMNVQIFSLIQFKKIR